MRDYFYNSSTDKIIKTYIPFLKKGIITKKIYQDFYEECYYFLPEEFTEDKVTFTKHEISMIVDAFYKTIEYYSEIERASLFSVYYLLLNYAFGKQSRSDVMKFGSHITHFMAFIGDIDQSKTDMVDEVTLKDLIVSSDSLTSNESDVLYRLAVTNIAKKCRMSESIILTSDVKTDIDNLTELGIYRFADKYCRDKAISQTIRDMGNCNDQYCSAPYYDRNSFMVVPYDIDINNRQKRNINKEFYVRY